MKINTEIKQNAAAQRQEPVKIIRSYERLGMDFGQAFFSPSHPLFVLRVLQHSAFPPLFFFCCELIFAARILILIQRWISLLLSPPC